MLSKLLDPQKRTSVLGVKVICIVVVAMLFHFGSEFVRVGVVLKILSVGVC
jgi:hypothetical protein